MRSIFVFRIRVQHLNMAVGHYAYFYLCLRIYGVFFHFYSGLSKIIIEISFSLYHFSPNLREKTIKIISLRVKKSASLETSVLFTIKLPKDDVDIDNVKWIGWEPNEQGKYIPRCASLASSMDPQK